MTAIELIWTITPALILIVIAFPSFRLLYLLDEVTSPTVTIKVTGHNGLKFIINNLKQFILKIRCNFYTFLYPQYPIKNLTVKGLNNDKLNMSHSHFLLSRSIARSSGVALKILSFTNITSKNYFHTRCRAINRIGPHNFDIISVMTGLLLGDGYLNNRSGEGARMAVKQSKIHKEYLFSLYKFCYNRGYCSSLEPRLYTRTLKGNDKTYYGYEFNTYTFRSFVWLQTLFYKNGKKVIPSSIGDLLTPLALAIWISDDGGWTGSGVRIATNSFNLEEVQFLIEILKTNFNLNCTVQKIHIKDKYSIYIKENSILKLRSLILPHLHESMFYKLGL